MLAIKDMGVIENINNFTYGKAIAFRGRAPVNHLQVFDETQKLICCIREGEVTFRIGSIVFKAMSNGENQGGKFQGIEIAAGEGGLFTFGTEEVILYVEGDV